MLNKAVLRWGLVLLWCAVIFLGTGDPHFTGEHTRAVVATAAPSVGVGSAGAVEWLNLALRKATHVVLFGVLGALAWTAFASWPGERRGLRVGLNRAAVWAWLVATLYAASDEWHQHFIPGRTASGWDVLLDSVAAGMAVLIVSYVTRYRARR